MGDFAHIPPPPPQKKKKIIFSLTLNDRLSAAEPPLSGKDILHKCVSSFHTGNRSSKTFFLTQNLLCKFFLLFGRVPLFQWTGSFLFVRRGLPLNLFGPLAGSQATSAG